MSDNLDSYRPPAKFDPFTTDELIGVMLSGPDEDESWDVFWTLHWRGNDEILDRAVGLTRSGCSIERAAGAKILGQLGYPDRTFPVESVDALFGILNREADPNVLYSTLAALSHQRDPRITAAAARFRGHDDVDVRRAVIHALGNYDDPISIALLIDLTGDQEAINRDWATFTLGSLLESDTPEVRAALFERLDDEDEVTRGEALVGLARRKDQRIVPFLAREISRSSVNILMVEAAELIADPTLYKPLIALKDRWDHSEGAVADAILACTSPTI